MQKIEEEKDNTEKFQVLVRLRPHNKQDKDAPTCVFVNENEILCGVQESFDSFAFDEVADETTSQDEIFRKVGLPIAEQCLMGYNGTIFAYGQTGSGKTFTLEGGKFPCGRPIKNPDHPLSGLTPRIIKSIYERMKVEKENKPEFTYTVEVSFFQIYLNKLYDLLNEPGIKHKVCGFEKKLKKFPSQNEKDAIELYFQGVKKRTTEGTKMNTDSSRSHSVFTLIITSEWCENGDKIKRTARLNVVDLAGCERLNNTEATGKRIKEAIEINRALSVLRRVITALSTDERVPYRDSPLTQLLSESLGGNSKTVIIANLAPSLPSLEQTKSTLEFADLAKNIKTKAVISEVIVLKEKEIKTGSVDQERQMIELKKINTGLREENKTILAEKTEEIKELKGKIATTQAAMKKMDEELQNKMLDTEIYYENKLDRKKKLLDEQNQEVDRLKEVDRLHDNALKELEENLRKVKRGRQRDREIAENENKTLIDKIASLEKKEGDFQAKRSKKRKSSIDDTTNLDLILSIYARPIFN